jgi:hypothetical protein|tara:strand:- start:5792 stop:6391 length:600 start_codon:yes stop_codon:yes gene_type:complete
MAITLRNTKGSELTFTELDANFTHLDGRIDSTGDSGYIKSVVNTTYFESIVDSAYVNARVNAGNSLDSAEAIALIDSAYVQARQVDLQRDSAFISNIVLNTVDSSYILAIAPEQDVLDSAQTIALIDSDHIESRMKQVLLNPFTVASAPSTGVEGQLIYVTDGNAGDACLAVFSGGSFKVVSTIGSTILDSAGGGGGGF